ncbi:tetratricopeptide repeat protein [Cerasicoccus frondis]|uniref:tetratricopeptide repeat protein n=1 Tax=Cerasicoccus frondis TaxID=490090 RepID=UPI0028525E7A|nr:tetratricopeptide repeat protein [Cerasicoccus frondis]
MPRISRFSPNWSDPSALEAITVAREELISKAVDAVHDSSLTKNKHHLLFVGPRGSGKTHLITLVHHRISGMGEVMKKLRIAWLNEDETSDTLLSLLLRVHRALAREYPQEFPADSTEAIYDLSDVNAASDAITKLVLKQLAEHTLLILVENLDAIFAEFNDVEQKRWRALIQNHPHFCTVATAQRLFDGVSDRDAPFFGFFDVHHLKPFSVEHATELLVKVAREKDDAELAVFIASPRGRARIRALHHLTGGNQRLFIILSEFINRKTLEELVRPFEELVDEQLTPYYQERLRWLPTLQRKIVEFLCTIAKPQPVKAISRQLFSSSQTISSQLVSLRRMGYVQSRKRGKESLYELAEPLMRLSHEVKEAKGRTPLRILVDFLRVWYDQEELKDRLQAAPHEAAITRMYLSEAYEHFEATGNLRLQLFRDEADGIDLTQCDEEQLDLLRDVKDESDDAQDMINYGVALAHATRLNEAIHEFTVLIKRKNAPAIQLVWALFNRGLAYGQRGDIEAALADYTAAINHEDASVKQLFKALFNRGIAHGQRGDIEAEMADYTAVINHEDAPAKQLALALVNRGVAHGQVGDIEAEIADYTTVINREDAPAEQLALALFNRGVAHRKRGDTEAAIADYTAVIHLEDAPVEQLALALVNRGFTHGQGGDIEAAIADYTAVINREDAPAEQLAIALFNRGATYRWRGEIKATIADYTTVINRENTPAELVAKTLVNRGFAHEERGDREAANTDYTAVTTLNHVPQAIVSNAHFRIANLEMQRGHWAEAEEHLISGFSKREPAESSYLGPIPQYIGAVLNSGQHADAWAPRLDMLLGVYAEHEAVTEFAAGLVDSLAGLRQSSLSPKGLSAWHALWAERAKIHPELELPARLLHTAINYFVEGEDESALLDLPSEERRILAQALGLESTTEGAE